MSTCIIFLYPDPCLDDPIWHVFQWVVQPLTRSSFTSSCFNAFRHLFLYLFFWSMIYWAVLGDEQISYGWPFSLVNDEGMSNKVRVEHQPYFVWTDVCVKQPPDLPTVSTPSSPKGGCSFARRLFRFFYSPGKATQVFAKPTMASCLIGFRHSRYSACIVPHWWCARILSWVELDDG